jgi:hypothetical protein
LELRVVNVVAAARAMLEFVGQRIGALVDRVRPSPYVRPEVEDRARRAFGELKNSRLFEPSDDLARTVLKRVRELAGNTSADDE